MRRLLAVVSALMIALPAAAQVKIPPTAVLTYHNDNQRTGQYNVEGRLIPTTVNAAKFGRLFTIPVDGYVYAQPLYVPGVAIPGKGTHNVVYVATEHDSVYAFDADNSDGANALPLWHTSFINPANGVTTVPSDETGSGDLVPEIGITATPVIDYVAGTIFVEAKTREVVSGNVNYVHRLHALDITTGAEKTHSPVVIDATVPGTGDGNDGSGHVPFNSLRQHFRPGLLLVKGKVFLATASHGDNGPYHGWVFGYDAVTLLQDAVLNTTPNGGLGGIWNAGCALAADSAGVMYTSTGNGTFSADPAFGNGHDYGDSVLRMAFVKNKLTVTDFFTPFNQDSLNNADADLASGGVILLPTQPTGTHKNMLVTCGKEGRIYLIDTKAMSHFHTDGDHIVQSIPNAVGGTWSSPAYWNNHIYYNGAGDVLKSFALLNGMLTTSPVSHSNVGLGFPGATPSISASGKNKGIAWVVQSDGYYNGGAPVLHAFDALDLTKELYNTQQAAGNRDDPGGSAVKFSVPTVANGKVYFGTSQTLAVYGLGKWVPNPAISPDGGDSKNPIPVTISDTDTAAQIRYTTDGTDPTPSSTLYTTGFTVSNSAVVKARAYRTGYQASGVVSALFIIGAGPGNGTGLYATYYDQIDLTGNTVKQVDPTVNFDWGGNPPVNGIPGNNWSARWLGQVQAETTTDYTFVTMSDDGVRLWVNNQLLIDNWTYHGTTTDRAVIHLTSGQKYDLRLEYFQGGGGSVMKLLWSILGANPSPIPQTQLYPVPQVDTPIIAPNGGTFANPVSVKLSDTTVGASIFYTLDGTTPTQGSTPYAASFTVSDSRTVSAAAFKTGMFPSDVATAPFKINFQTGSGDGLTGNYFPNIDLTGTPVTRIDPTIDFDWGGGSPINGIGGTNWSARWTGKVQPQYSGVYTFLTNTDDGVRVWVNGTLIIDDWTYHAPTLDSGTISLTANQKYDIKIEFFQGGGGSVMQLFWKQGGQQTVVPQTQLYSK